MTTKHSPVATVFQSWCQNVLYLRKSTNLTSRLNWKFQSSLLVLKCIKVSFTPSVHVFFFHNRLLNINIMNSLKGVEDSGESQQLVRSVTDKIYNLTSSNSMFCNLFCVFQRLASLDNHVWHSQNYIPHYPTHFPEFLKESKRG